MRVAADSLVSQRYLPGDDRFPALASAIRTSPPDPAKIGKALESLSRRIEKTPLTLGDALEVLPMLERAYDLTHRWAGKSLGERIASVLLDIITLGIYPLVRSLDPSAKDRVNNLADKCRDKLRTVVKQPQLGLPPPVAPARLAQDGHAILTKRHPSAPEVHVLNNGELTIDGHTGHLPIYEAALLYAQDHNWLASVTPQTKANLVEHLIGQYDSALAHYQWAREQRSGSATLLMALAVDALRRGDRALATRITGGFIDLIGREPENGLRVSMITNLRTQLQVPPSQTAALDRLAAEALPTKPPYEQWFKDGKRELHIKHYMHHEFMVLDSYQRRGYTVEDLGGGKFRCTGKEGDLKVVVDVMQVEGYSTDSQILEEMNNDKYQVLIYTGHSNLGGNIAMAMEAAPSRMIGGKLVVAGMCRGQQNVAHNYQRWPDAHLVTTAKPMHIWGLRSLVDTTLDGISKREGYAWMSKQIDRDGQPFFPTDSWSHKYRDDDRDGRPDGGLDVLYDVRSGSRTGEDVFTPLATPPDPTEIDGARLTNATAFVRTMLTYHGEHDSKSPMPEATGERITANGFYADSSSHFMRITPGKDGKLQIAINSKYAHLSEGALAMRMLYELNRFFSEREGSYEREDQVRGLLLAQQWLSFMSQGAEQHDALVRGLAETYGWPTEGPGAINAAFFAERASHYGDTSTAQDYVSGARKAAWDALDIR